MSQNSPCIIYTPKDRVCCAERTRSSAKHTRDQELASPTLPITSPTPRTSQHLPWTEDTHYLSVFWKTRQKNLRQFLALLGTWGEAYFISFTCSVPHTQVHGAKVSTTWQDGNKTAPCDSSVPHMTSPPGPWWSPVATGCKPSEQMMGFRRKANPGVPWAWQYYQGVPSSLVKCPYL